MSSQIAFKLNNNYFFRIENFGGLIISRDNLNVYELDKEHAYYIYLFALTEDIEIAKKHSNLTFNQIRELKKNLVDLGILNKNVISNSGNKTQIEVLESKDELFSKCPINSLSYPLQITFYPSYFCNLKCRFCFLTEDKSSKESLDIEVLKNIVCDADKQGVLSFSILGGEPLLYPKILDLLNYIENKKLEYQLHQMDFI